MTSLSARDYSDFDPWDVVLNAVPGEYSFTPTGYRWQDNTDYEFVAGIWDRMHPEAAVQNVSFDLSSNGLTPTDPLRESPEPPPPMPQQKSIPTLYDEWLEKRARWYRDRRLAKRNARLNPRP